MTKINLTKNELIAIKSITESDFYDGRGSIQWDFSVYDICPLKGKTKSGTFGSLANKGIISTTHAEKKFNKDENGNRVKNPYWQQDGNNYGTIGITENGFDILIEIGVLDKEWQSFINE